MGGNQSLRFCLVQVLAGRNPEGLRRLASATMNDAMLPKLQQLEVRYRVKTPDQKTSETSISTAERPLPETPL